VVKAVKAGVGRKARPGSGFAVLLDPEVDEDFGGTFELEVEELEVDVGGSSESRSIPSKSPSSSSKSSTPPSTVSSTSSPSSRSSLTTSALVFDFFLVDPLSPDLFPGSETSEL
jgi:hypothetical protein